MGVRKRINTCNMWEIAEMHMALWPQVPPRDALVPIKHWMLSSHGVDTKL